MKNIKDIIAESLNTTNINESKDAMSLEDINGVLFLSTLKIYSKLSSGKMSAPKVTALNKLTSVKGINNLIGKGDGKYMKPCVYEVGGINTEGFKTVKDWAEKCEFTLDGNVLSIEGRGYVRSNNVWFVDEENSNFMSKEITDVKAELEFFEVSTSKPSLSNKDLKF